MHARVVLGVGKGVLFREVSSVQECPHKEREVPHIHSHNTDDPAALSIRLVGGASVREGRVEILFGDEWGGVCDDGWGQEEAIVVCRELGLSYTPNQPTSE